MELLGHSLEYLFQTHNKKFSLKTVCMLGIQILDRVEYLHSKKIIHRDIKPDNFCIGKGKNSHIVYLVDFGLSKKYWSVTQRCHIPYTIGKSLTGTARYASINALSGCEQSRRDDLESIAYILLYFLKGRLPWQGLKCNKKEDKFEKILEKKKEISSADLCKEFPKEFEFFLDYIKLLGFPELPDYEYLKNLLAKIIDKYKFKIDFYYDWCMKRPNISEDNIIFTNDYGIEYNGQYEWLVKNDENITLTVGDINEDENDDIKCMHKGVNKIKENEKYFENMNIEEIFSLKNLSTFKTEKNIMQLNKKIIKNCNDSINGSGINETNYTSNKKNVVK